MSENPQTPKRSFSADWLVQGALARIGDAFDRWTGRGWKPVSSLATSELVERLLALLDSEARENGEQRKYVPHNIKLKMQWDKFSTDAEEPLNRLREELLTAAVDHINDKRYYTYAPLSLEVTPDYFTSGVKLLAGFGTFDRDHEAEVDVSIPQLNTTDQIHETDLREGRIRIQYAVRGKPVDRTLNLIEGTRLSVGRTKENDIVIDDPSVSKFHASLLLNADENIVVSDTGSTNGTFVNGERIAYGKAVEIADGSAMMFGDVKVSMSVESRPSSNVDPSLPSRPETYAVGEFEFSRRAHPAAPAETKGRVDIARTSKDSDVTDRG